jgi:protein SCO1
VKIVPLTRKAGASNVRAVAASARIDRDPAEAPTFGSRVQAFVAGLVGRASFWIVFVVLAFGLPVVRSMTRPLPKVPDPIGMVSPFSLVDQEGRTLSEHDLRGQVWVGGFVAMSESQAGDDLTKTMARIRFRTRNLSHAFHLVSFSLDAARDTVENRKAFADRFHAASPTWSFLGGDPTAVETALSGFGLTSTKTPLVGEMSKREKLVLVDQFGRIRGWYGTDLSSIDAIVADVGNLANDVSAPTSPNGLTPYIDGEPSTSPPAH